MKGFFITGNKETLQEILEIVASLQVMNPIMKNGACFFCYRKPEERHAMDCAWHRADTLVRKIAKEEKEND